MDRSDTHSIWNGNLYTFWSLFFPFELFRSNSFSFYFIFFFVLSFFFKCSTALSHSYYVLLWSTYTHKPENIVQCSFVLTFLFILALLFVHLISSTNPFRLCVMLSNGCSPYTHEKTIQTAKWKIFLCLSKWIYIWMDCEKRNE